MIPLILADAGQELTIRKIGGSPEARQHLADMGFNVGTSVTVITAMEGNVIVKVKDSRVAISREAAQKIMV